jgi:hypothetical protein
LRDHISSRNEIDRPSWLRNSASHSITAPSRTPKARATYELFCEKNWLMNPQISICRVGQ